MPGAICLPVARQCRAGPGRHDLHPGEPVPRPQDRRRAGGPQRRARISKGRWPTSRAAGGRWSIAGAAASGRARFASILAQIGWRVDTLAGGYSSYRALVVQAVYDTPLPAPGRPARRQHRHRQDRAAAPAGGARRAGDRPRGAAPPPRLALRAIAPAASPRRRPSRAALAPPLSPRSTPPARWCRGRIEQGRRPALSRRRSGRRCAPRRACGRRAAGRPRPLPARAYADLTADPAEIARVIDLLRPQHAAEVIHRWQALAAAGDHETLAAELMEQHYDPRYARQRARVAEPGAVDLVTQELTPEALEALADRLMSEVAKL